MPPKLSMDMLNILKALAHLPGLTRPRRLLRGQRRLTRRCAQHPSAPCRVQSLQLHHELDLAHLGASTDLNDGRARRRAWQQRLNGQIQQLTLRLLVSVFRYSKHFQVGRRPSLSRAHDGSAPQSLGD